MSKAIKQIRAVIQQGEGDNKKSYWNRIGTAFHNERSDTWTLVFDYFPANPANTTLQLAEIKRKPDDSANN